MRKVTRTRSPSCRADVGAPRHWATGAAPTAEPLFSHAVRLAQNGANAVDLVKACGLNEAEARLMCRLHGRTAA